MCASLWPGLVSEGPPFCKDLTAPPVYLQTLSTPCGTMGAVIPLGITLLYISSIDLSAGGEQAQSSSLRPSRPPLLQLPPVSCVMASGITQR